MTGTGSKRGGGVGSGGSSGSGRGSGAGGAGSGGSSVDGGQDYSLVFRHALLMASPFHCRAVIEEVLDWRDAKKVSRSAADQLESALGSLGLELPGYRNPYRAPKVVLIDPLVGEMIDNDRLSGAVLRVWVESRPDLRELVLGYAASRGLPVDGPDFKGRCFRGSLSLGSWNSAAAGILGESKVSLDPDDVALMLCMVTGRLPGVIGHSSSAVAVRSSDFPFAVWLSELREMMSDPSGMQASVEFLSEAERLVSERLDESKQVRDLAMEAVGLCLRFMPELVHLGRELPGVLSPKLNLSPVESSSLSEASSLLDRLGRALEEYRGERLAVHVSWSRRLEGIERERLAAEGALSLIERLHEVFPERVEAVPEEVEEEAEEGADGVAAADEGGSAEWDALQLEMEGLREENARLRRELHFARAAEESLRGRVERGESGESGVSLAPVSDVREAVERAEGEFGGKELLFCLNSASKVDTQFERAEEAFSVLRWLATDYRSARIEGGMPNPDQSLREACAGWSFAPDNSYVAMSKYRDAYTAKGPNGRVYELGHHIRRGIRNNEKHTMRIAFAWDDADKRVVIGYIGKHQPNDF